MRKYYLSTAAVAALIAGFALSPAQADVFVTADIDKEKTVTVTETVTITKNVTIGAAQHLEIDRSAESLAIANQRIEENTVGGDGSGNHVATVDHGSVAHNTGVVQFNNAAGHLNQQGNLLAAAVDGSGGAVNSFADAQASAQQVIGTDPHGGHANRIDSVGGNDATTSGSITGNVGVVHGNNAAGDMNQQLNTLSLAVAFAGEGSDALALAEADLGQFLGGNTVNVVARDDGNTATISGSIIGNTGIVGYNQASGAMNQQANVVAVSATAPAQAAFQ